MKSVIVIGLGSMGRRRIGLLQQRNDVSSIIGVDSKPERRKEAEEKCGIVTAESIDEAIEKGSPECAFISTSPLSHAAIITECLEKGLNVFTEINLVSVDYEKNIELAKKQNKVLFLSSTFLYREEISYIASRVKAEEGPQRYIYHVGQYLPDWHPWENYKDFFVGDKRTNGCREIMAIELPWITQTFGKIESIESTHGKLSGLNIGYDDNYFVKINHAGGSTGIFAVDILSRKAVRNLEVYSEDIYLSWDGSPSGIGVFEKETGEYKKVDLQYEAVHKEGYQSTITENAYANEIEEFFAAVYGNKKPAYGFEEDLITLGWIDKIEE